MRTLALKAPVTKVVLGRFKPDITHDRVLAISVNIPTKTFCPVYSDVYGAVKVVSVCLAVHTGLGGD